MPRTSTVNRRDSSDSSDSDRFQRGRGYSHERGRPPERERERDIQVEIEIEGLPEEEDYQVMEDPQTDLLENHLEEDCLTT